MKLTISMIVKNEEKYLEECLNSVHDIADEIVIVDTGSTDKTLEIAKKYNAKIYEYKWSNDFSEARNFALSKSNGNWILYLDADERLHERSKTELEQLIKSNEKLGINCIVNSVSTEGGNSQKMKYIRLFKNDLCIGFSGKAHEQIELSLKSNGYKIIDSNIEIIHLGYDVSDEILKMKAERNLRLLLEDYRERETSYLAYQIANSYSVLKNEKAKIKYFRRALKDKNLNNELRSVCYAQLAEYEFRKDNLEEALKYVDEALTENGNQILILMVAAQVYGKLENYEMSIGLCEKAIRLFKESSWQNNNFKFQQINISLEKVLYQGMILSILSENSKKYTFFSEILKKSKLREVIIYNKLINNNLLVSEEIDQLTQISNNDNIELIIILLSNYHQENKISYLHSAYLKFNQNNQFISAYVSNLINLNKIQDAQEILETSFNNENYSLPLIMYLASIYVQTNQLNLLTRLLEKLDFVSNENYELGQKLIPLKNKLIPLLQKLAI